MKGKNFLKVSGILMIIGGAIALIVAILAVLGVAVIAAALSDQAAAGTLLYVAAVLALLSAVAEFVAGIVGVKNSAKPEKATACIVWGAIVALFCVLGQVLNVVAGSTINVFSLVLGLVLPALYIIGAVLNKKAA